MAMSIILGWILVGLGILCILIGLSVAVVISLAKIVENLKKSLVATLDEKQLKLMQFIIELFKEMLKSPGGIFFVVGLILIGGGVYLLTKTPF
jgi:hypothetical protein